MVRGLDAASIPAIEMSTSAGLPYTECGLSKRAMIEVDSTGRPLMIKKGSLLERRFTERHEMAKKGVQVYSEWFNTFKDERRPLEKINKTRIFCVGPLDFNLLVRKYAGCFIQHFIDTRRDHFGKVGLDVHSYEWHEFVESLYAVSDVGFDGDYSRYDGIFSSEVWYRIFDLIEDFTMGPDRTFHNVYQTLAEESSHTIVRAGNIVYQKHGGNPSGHALTTIANCIQNAVFSRYVWYKKAPAHMRDFTIFGKNVVEANYGDDNLFSVSTEAIDFFNQNTYTEVMASIGVTYTDASKSEALTPYKPVIELSFLKCKIGKVEVEGLNRFTALLSEETIREMLYWIRCDEGPLRRKEALDQNIESASLAVFQYGRQYYNEWRKKLDNAYFDLYRCYPTVQSYDCLYSKYYAIGVVPQGLDNMSASSSGTFGIEMLETKDTQKQSATKGDDVDASGRAHTHMNTTPWDLNMMTERNALIDSLPWSVTDAENTILKSYQVPFGLLKTAIQKEPFDRFTFWRGKATIRFQVNGSRFHAGRLIAYFVPLHVSASNQYIWDSRVLQSQCQHVFIDPAKGDVVELEIPFRHPKSFLSIADPNDYLGYLYVSIFNKLSVATSVAPTINVSVVARIQSEFHIPVPSDVAAMQLRNMRSEVVVVKPQGILDVITKPILGGIDAAWDALAKKIRPSEIIGDGIDAVMGMSGMDKPNDTVQPNYLVRKPLGYLNNAQQIEHIERMTLYPGSLNTCDTEHFGTTKDEMNISYLVTIMALIDTVTWSATQTQGTILSEGLICPMPILSANGTALSTEKWYLSPMEYFSSKFTFWRGGIKMKIDIVCSQMVTGRLFLGYHYGAGVPADGEILNAASQYGATIDVNDGRATYEFVMPFMSETPWKRVPNRKFTLSSYDPEHSIFVLGTWSLRVVNPLITPVGVASSVEINLFMGAAEDYEVNFLSNNNSTLIVASNEGVQRRLKVRPQGTEVAEDVVNDAKAESTEQNAVTLAPTRAYATNNIHFTEKYESIRDCLKRYHPIARFTRTIENIRFNNIPALSGGYQYPYAVIDIGYYLKRSRGQLAWFMAPYASYRGSLRFKFLIDWTNGDFITAGNQYSKGSWLEFIYDPNPIETAPTSTTVGIYSSIANLGPVVYTTDQNDVKYSPAPTANFLIPSVPSSNTAITTIATEACPYAEFEVPFATWYNILTNPCDFPAINASVTPDAGLEGKLGHIYVMGTPRYEDSIEINLWVSFADDTRVGMFVCTPPVVMNPIMDVSGNKQPQWPDAW